MQGEAQQLKSAPKEGLAWDAAVQQQCLRACDATLIVQTATAGCMTRVSLIASAVACKLSCVMLYWQHGLQVVRPLPACSCCSSRGGTHLCHALDGHRLLHIACSAWRSRDSRQDAHPLLLS